MQNIFENMSKEEGTGDGESATPEFNMPSADDIQGHLHSMMGGKLGDLAREIAEETSQNLNMDMEGVTDVKDIFQKLFSNPGKLMGLVKNVSEKLDSRMKSGEISQNELMTEASEMLNKMKNMPGMGNIQEMLGKMGMGGMGRASGAGGMDMGDLAAMAGMAGLGRNAKINTGAMQQQMDRLSKQEAFRNRIKKKMEAKNLAQLTAAANVQQPAQHAPQITDEELIAMFGAQEKEKAERTPRASKPKDSSGKKKKKSKA